MFWLILTCFTSTDFLWACICRSQAHDLHAFLKRHPSGFPRIGLHRMKSKGAERFWMTGLSAIFTPGPITLGKLTDYQMMCCRVAWLLTRRPLHIGGHRLLTPGIIAVSRAHCVCPPHMAFGTELLLSLWTNEPCLAGECQALRLSLSSLEGSWQGLLS